MNVAPGGRHNRARLPGRDLQVEPRRVAIALTAIVLAMAAVAFVLGVVRFGGGIDRENSLYVLFDFADERNIPTAFATLLLLAAAGLALWAAVLARRRGPRAQAFWLLFVVILTYLAIDEALEIHERALQGLAERWIQGSLSQQFAWVFPAAVLVLLVAAALGRFVIDLPPRYRWAFIGAALLYVGGAIFVEVFADIVFYYTESLPARASVTLTAETLELLGVTLLIYGLLEHLADPDLETEKHVEAAGRS